MATKKISNTFISIFLTFFLLSSYFAIAEINASTLINTYPKSYFYLIIDDLGYQKTDYQFIELPFPLIISILPNTPYAQKLTNLAHRYHKDVLIHQPMTSLHTSTHKQYFPSITPDSSEHFIQSTIQDASIILPQAIGLNNHQGSSATQSIQSMHFLMRTLKSKNLFFVDSVTSKNSIAWKIAKLNDIPYVKRDIFLDHNPDTVSMKKALTQAILIGRQKKHVVIIAHPKQATLYFLKKWIPLIEQMNITLQPLRLHPSLLNQPTK